MNDNAFRAGAGRAEIELPVDLFPTEGFIGVHDTLHVRVLLLENDHKVAFASVELTSLPENIVIALQKSLAEEAGLSEDNVLISVTHTFSVPHFVPKHLCKTTDDDRKNELLFQALNSAVREATAIAQSKMRDARLGYATGLCDVNVNRDVFTADGWWLGSNETGPSDKTVSVLRFETLQGKPIALLFNYAVQPSVIDGSQLATGGRLVSSDLAGAASLFLEQEFGDVTAFFLIGAAGDQAPSIRAQFRYVGKDGQIQIEDIHEQGFMIAEMLGKRLGAEVLRVAETLKCQDRGNSIVIQHYIVKCPGQKIADMKSIHPTKEYEFILAEDRNEPVVIIRLDDIAMVGVRPELSCVTAESIRDQSPFPHTMIMTLVNGGAKYMPDESAYDRITYEAMNSFFARGSAELLCEKVLGFLRKRI